MWSGTPKERKKVVVVIRQGPSTKRRKVPGGYYEKETAELVEGETCETSNVGINWSINSEDYRLDLRAEEKRPPITLGTQVAETRVNKSPACVILASVIQVSIDCSFYTKQSPTCTMLGSVIHKFVVYFSYARK